MAEATLSDIQNDVAALRREMDDLRARLQSPPGAGGDDTTGVVISALKENLRREMDSQSHSAGLAVADLVLQIDGRGGEGATFSLHRLTDAAAFPDDDRIAAKVGRVARYVQSPLLLRALRYLFLPHFEGQPKRRTKTELAAHLSIDEAEVERLLQPIVEENEMRWGKNAAGEEYYEWSGNGLPMLLLIQG